MIRSRPHESQTLEVQEYNDDKSPIKGAIQEAKEEDENDGTSTNLRTMEPKQSINMTNFTRFSKSSMNQRIRPAKSQSNRYNAKVVDLTTDKVAYGIRPSTAV